MVRVTKLYIVLKKTFSFYNLYHTRIEQVDIEICDIQKKYFPRVISLCTGTANITLTMGPIFLIFGLDRLKPQTLVLTIDNKSFFIQLLLLCHHKISQLELYRVWFCLKYIFPHYNKVCCNRIS